MGIIEKVGYKVDGKSVIVTMQNGMMKGSSVRYVLSDATLRAMGTSYKRAGLRWRNFPAPRAPLASCREDALLAALHP